jgi:predicted ABC-type ATPase
VVYFWLQSADLAVMRVAERVRLGGHNVAEATIRQRYGRSLHNFFQLYRPLATTWEVYNNSTTGGHDLLAYKDTMGNERVVRIDQWALMQHGQT